MANIVNELQEAEKYADNIMESIMDILDINSIQYSINNNKTEIIISSSDLNTIKSIIMSNNNIPENVYKLLIEIISTNDNKIYIRQKIK